MNDRLSDLARADVPDCDCGVGRNAVSSEVIRVISHPGAADESTDFPTIAFRSVVAVKEFTK